MPGARTEHRASTAVGRLGTQALQTGRGDRLIDAEQQEMMAQNPGSSAPTHQHETEYIE